MWEGLTRLSTGVSSLGGALVSVATGLHHPPPSSLQPRPPPAGEGGRCRRALLGRDVRTQGVAPKQCRSREFIHSADIEVAALS